jgi:hypothetical protein
MEKRRDTDLEDHSDKIIVEKIERASGRRAFAAQAAAIEALAKIRSQEVGPCDAVSG